MDEHGYPTEAELIEIREWPHTDIDGLIEFCQELTEAYGTWTIEGRKAEFSTGGWSGNEDVLGAMADNSMFWAICWVSSRRGGHYEFELPKK